MSASVSGSAPAPLLTPSLPAPRPLAVPVMRMVAGAPGGVRSIAVDGRSGGQFGSDAGYAQRRPMPPSAGRAMPRPGGFTGYDLYRTSLGSGGGPSTGVFGPGHGGPAVGPSQHGGVGGGGSGGGGPGATPFVERSRRIEAQLASLKTGLVGLQRSLREAQAHLLTNRLHGLQNSSTAPAAAAVNAPATAPATSLLGSRDGQRPSAWTTARVLDQVLPPANGHATAAAAAPELRLAMATAASLLVRGRRRLDPDATESSSGESDHGDDAEDGHDAGDASDAEASDADLEVTRTPTPTPTPTPTSGSGRSHRSRHAITIADPPSFPTASTAQPLTVASLRRMYVFLGSRLVLHRSGVRTRIGR